MAALKRIGIFGRTLTEERKPAICQLLKELVQQDADLCIYDPFYRICRSLIPEQARISTFHSYADLPADLNCMITIGGDGTLLEAVTHVRHSRIPLLGINTGRLGFLSGFSKDEMELAARMALSGEYHLEQRSLIQVETPGDYFEDTPFALNEVTFHKRDTSSMITLHVKMDGRPLNSYWADGLIISTPTGSTGYSLSCGGPIMMPESKNLIITPIAPHNLNVRPLVIADSSVLSIEAEVRGRHFMIALDSRSAIVPSGESVGIRKADFSIQLARKPDQEFLGTLREKLMWGIDKRN